MFILANKLRGTQVFTDLQTGKAIIISSGNKVKVSKLSKEMEVARKANKLDIVNEMFIH